MIILRDCIEHTLAVDYFSCRCTLRYLITSCSRSSCVRGAHRRLVASPPLRTRAVCRFFYSRTHARTTSLSSSPSAEVALSVSVVPWAAIVLTWTRCQERGAPRPTLSPSLSHTHTRRTPNLEPSLRRTHSPPSRFPSTVSKRLNNRPARDVSRQRGSCWMKRLLFQPPPHIWTWAEWAAKLFN